VQEEIKKELTHLESQHDIKILYAIESGSRAWGFASKNSDWDVRFLYVHRPEWYLSINDQADNIEEILPNDIDLGGWELRKALKLFHKSNPPLMEWLNSPILYKESGTLAASLRDLSRDFFIPKNCLHHYLHMAEGNFKDYLQTDLVRTKKYFYVLRPVLACRWIEKYQSMPPMEFATMFQEFITEATLRQEIETLLERKMQGEELDAEPKIQILNDYLSTSISYFQDLVKTYGKTLRADNEPLNMLFRQTLASAWYNNFT
jgi:uncharacterized protein